MVERTSHFQFKVKGQKNVSVVHTQILKTASLISLLFGAVLQDFPPPLRLLSPFPRSNLDFL